MHLASLESLVAEAPDEMIRPLRSFLRLLLLIALLLGSAGRPAFGQGPAEPWRTLSTEHFRVHYPVASEAWATRAASRLESIRDAVVREVGYAPPQIVDVVIMDPAAQANGSAWPILPWPRMVLWTSPPGPASVIGHYRDWGELLIVHEQGHLAHLLRPSRHRLEDWSSRFLPIGPISRRAPRWLSEGYATYLEGKLTGYGRPHSDLRAVVLRRWAQLGELPSYGRLASDSQSWMGMSMAYLVGSTYIEWLVEREGSESLRQLWARMSARQLRPFDAAFAGVFGDSPAKLYKRFCAELTYRAMRTELETEPHLATGELWQDLAWTSGAPEVSPDGEKLAMVLRSKDGPSRLVVWSTAPDLDAESNWQEKRDRLVALDPDDVPAVRHRPLPREPLFELKNLHRAAPHTPRWLADDALLYVRYEPDAAGFLHPDLFRWDLESGWVERLTHGADLREPDPAPSGTWAVAVRQRHGLSQLVRVSLADGVVTELTEAAVDVGYHRPRVDPKGERIAFVRHQGGAWQLIVRVLSNGSETVLFPSHADTTGSTVAFPSWAADGQSIFAVVGTGGFLDIHQFDVESGRSRQVTRSHGATLAPAPTPDGQRLFFLRLEADGLKLATLDRDSRAPFLPAIADAPGVVGLDASLEPVIRVPSKTVATFEEEELGASQPYRAGRPEFFPILGGSFAPSGHAWEAGGRVGDLIGRLDVLALVGGGDGAPQGGAVAVAWRGPVWPGLAFPKGTPFTLGARLFALEERPSEQPTAVPGLGSQLDLDRQGLELTAEWTRRRRGSVARLVLGATLAEIEPINEESGTLDQNIGFLRFGHRSNQAAGMWRFGQQFDLLADGGRTGGDSWRRFGGRARITVGRRSGSRLGVTWRRRSVEDAIQPFDRLQLGGVPGSLLPRSALGGRLIVPALPVGTRLGDEYEGQRLDLRSGRWPFTFFYERHRLWDAGQPQGDWLALRGVELSLRREPMPLLRLPAFDLRVGVAEILDEPLRDQWEGWLALAWSP